MLRSFVLIALLIPSILQAQLMELSNGTLHVLGATRLSVEGPMTWHLAPSANVINDGTIEFGPEAMLEEEEGAPITGTGLETTSRIFPGAIVDNEPAGLGLSLSTATPIGALTLIRGHEPYILMNGGTGIARWYQLQTNDLPGALLETRLKYDPTELNGLSATTLDLYTAVDPTDFWTPRSGEATTDPWAVTAEIFWPWVYITAFEADATTSSNELPNAGFRAWPTITNGIVHLEALGTRAITHWELRDASGRLHLGKRHGSSGVHYQTIDLTSLSGGLYLLRVNGSMVIKLLNQ